MKDDEVDGAGAAEEVLPPGWEKCQGKTHLINTISTLNKGNFFQLMMIMHDKIEKKKKKN